MNRFQFFLVGAITMFLAACGGKSSFSGSSGNPIAGPAANVVTAVVNGGPNNNAANTLYTTVTICAPGSTTNCQTIDNIEIDTGSSGLRILAAALTADLPIQMDSNGNSFAECTQFVDGYSWGPLALADLTISQETAQNLPVQVIGDPNFATVPSDCANTGPAEDTVAAFGANGILGVAPPAQDCGSDCAVPNSLGFYYSCSSATNCVAVAVPVGNQVQNPVTFFPTDNNGVIIELPSVAATGAASATGALVGLANDVRVFERLAQRYGLSRELPGHGFEWALLHGQLADAMYGQRNNRLLLSCKHAEFLRDRVFVQRQRHLQRHQSTEHQLLGRQRRISVRRQRDVYGLPDTSGHLPVETVHGRSGSAVLFRP